jgi:sugar (pentulose or hexulose) kinase
MVSMRCTSCPSFSEGSSYNTFSFCRQGSRTPHTDPLARGAFVGLSLSHTRAHLFRALLEAVCYGTRACFDALESAAQQRASTAAIQKSNDVIIAGGELKSWHT